MAAGVNTSIIIDVSEQRKKKDIKPVKCNCNTCLYFNHKKCRFNKNLENRRYCIKYTYSKPSKFNQKKIEKPKKTTNVEQNTIKKTSFKKISDFFGVKITIENLRSSYRSYSNGYSLKLMNREPLKIAIRNNRTKKKFYYEVIV